MIPRQLLVRPTYSPALVPVKILRSTNGNDCVGVCESREDADSSSCQSSHRLWGGGAKSHSFEFSNCARTAMIATFDVLESTCSLGPRRGLFQSLGEVVEELLESLVEFVRFVQNFMRA